MHEHLPHRVSLSSMAVAGGSLPLGTFAMGFPVKSDIQIRHVGMGGEDIHEE